MIDIIKACEEYGVDYERLNKVLAGKDNWGKMVHAFEYLTVLGVVEDAMRQRIEASTSET